MYSNKTSIISQVSDRAGDTRHHITIIKVNIIKASDDDLTLTKTRAPVTEYSHTWAIVCSWLNRAATISNKAATL